MAVYKATKKKMESGGEFKATENRTIDTAMVYGWEKTYNESYDTLEKYRKRIEGGEYLSSDDLSAYEKAMNSYVDAASNMRFLSKSMGKNDIDDKEWENSVSQMRENFKGLYDHYSRWDTKEKYDSAVAAGKEYEGKKNLDIEAAEQEIRDYEDALEAYNNTKGLYWQDHYASEEERQAAIDRYMAHMEKYGIDPNAYTHEYDRDLALAEAINSRRAYIKSAQYIQDGIKLASAVDNDDFAENSKYVSTADDGGWDKLWSDYSMGYGDLTYEYINGDADFRAEVERKHDTFNKHGRDSKYKDNGYDLLEENEIAIYNYYYAKEGKEAAEKYLDSIQGALNERKANTMFSGMEGNTLLELAFGVSAGLDQFKSGIKGAWNSITGDDSYIPPSATQMASGMVREDLADDGFKFWYNFKEGEWEDKILGNSLGQVAYDSTTTTANMLPSILTSVAIGTISKTAGTAVAAKAIASAGQVAGAGLLGTSAAGNAYQEMVNLGYNKQQAGNYAALVGASEAGLQYLLGGISKMGGKLSGNAISKIVSGVDNALARTAIKLGGSMLSEGFEEGLQEILTPWFQNLTLHTDNDVNWNDVAYSSLLGALTAGFMEGGGIVATEVGTYRTGKSLQAAGISGQRLAEIGQTFSADSVAYQLAGKVNENTGAYTLGRLFNEIGAELTEANKAEIAQELEKRGVSAKDARVMVDAMANVVLGGSFTDKQIAILEANDVLTKAVVDVVINPNSTVNQRSQGYKEILSDLAKQKASNTVQTEPVSQSGENAIAENTVSAETETASQGDYEAAVEGKTIRKSTGEAVNIKEVASVDAGKMTLRLEDGSEVEYKELAYSSTEEAYVFEMVANLGVDAKEATRLINAFRNSGVDGKAFADGVRLAFEYGYGNFSRQELARMDIAGNIPPMYVNTAYEIGQKMREQETNGGVQYSFKGYADDGKGIYESNFPKGTPKKAKGERILKYIQDVWSKKPITLRINEGGKVRHIKAQFDPNYDETEGARSDARKLMGGNRHGNAMEQRVTLDLADDYYQIASESEYNYSKDETGKDTDPHQGVKRWHYFINDIYFAEQGSDELTPYRVSINVKENADGNFFYSFSAEKTEGTSTQRTLHAAVNSSETTANGSSSGTSIRNPGKTVNKKVSGKARGIYYTTKDGKAIPVDQAEKNGKLALKDKQSVAVKTAKFLQKLGVGSNYYFFESYVDQKGHRVFKDRFGNVQAAPNGLYYSDGDIYIDINAGTDSHNITLRTLSHELTHMIQQWSAAKYKGIADFLAEQYDKEGRSAYEAAKAKQAELSEHRGRRVSFQEAYHEFVADSMSTMFDDGNLYDILTDLKKKDKTIFDYIKKFFDGLAAKVRDHYANTRAETDEGQFVQGLSKETVYRLQQMFADALVDASENYEENADIKHNDVIDVQLSDRETLSQAAENLATITDEDYLKEKSAFPFVLVMDHTPQKVLESMKNDDGSSMAKNRRIIIRRDALYLAIREDGVQEGHYHGLGAEVLKKLPEYLEQPDAILQTDGSDNRRLVLTHIQGEKGQAIVSVEFESVKDYDGKNDFFNVIITVFDLHQNYLKGLFKKRNAVVKYEKEDLAQVNPQLHKWLRTFNAMSSNDNVTQLDLEVKQNSDRTSVPSRREILAQALEGVAANMEDYQTVQEYRQIVPLLDAEEAKLSRLNAEIREMTFGKGSKDREKLTALRLEAKQTQNRIDIYDRQLLKLEAAAPLQKVLEREKAKAYKKAAEKGKEAVRKEKERAEAKYKELAEKNAAARKKGIDSRTRTALRHKVQSVVSELNDLLLSNDKKRHVPDSMKKAVADALSLVNMDAVGAEERVAKYAALIENETDPDKIEAYTVTMENIRRQGEKVGQRLSDLHSAYEEIQNSEDPDIANAYDPVIAGSLKELAQSIGNTPIRDMSAEQLSDVYDMYRMVLTRVRDANKAFAEGISASIGDIASSVIREVKSAGGEHTYRAAALDPVRKFQWDNLKPVYAMERLGSSTMSKVFETVRAGEDTWAKDVVDARKYYLDKSKKYGYDSWDFDKKTKFESASGIEFELSLEQILSLYAYSKRDQAADHLRLGGFVFDSNIETHKEKGSKLIKYKVNTAEAHQITPEILAQITGTLTPEQKAFVDEMQDYLSTVMGAKGNEVTMKMYGVKLFKEKHYFPLKSARQFMFEQNEVSGEVRIKNSGFTNKVIAMANNPVILNNFMDVWSGHVNDMSMYHAFVLPLEDFNRVFNYNSPKSEGKQSVSVKGTIQNAYSPAAVSYMKQLITDLNGGVVTDPRETLAKTMIAKFKKAKVFSSASVVIQQPSAIGRAFALVDPKYFHFTKDGMKHSELWSEVKQYAPVTIIKEMGYFDTDMGRSTKDFIAAKEYSGIKEKAKALFADGTYRDEVLSKAPALADEITWCAIWNAVKRETKAKNPGLSIKSEELLQKAGKRFTEVITKTQVYDSVLSRSANMRSKSGLMSMATSFMAEPTTTINMIEDALIKAKRGNKRYAARAFAAAAVSILLNNALVALVYGARDDDEKETYLEKYSQALLSNTLDDINPITYYPFLKDMWSLLQGYDVERADMSLVADMTDALKGLVKAYTSDNGDVAGAWWDIAGSAANIGGIPAQNISRDVKGAINFVKTLIDDASGGETTWGSMGDALGDAVRDSLPVVGWLSGETKGDKLYDAIVNGDGAYVDRLKSGYKDESSYRQAVRKALRENDSRIKEAAEAKVNGDSEEYLRLAKEIIAEKHFVQDDVVAAINAEINALLKAKKSEAQ